MSTLKLDERWTEAEFLAWQTGQSERYELVDGMPLRMMSGARRAHDRVVRNVIVQLGTQLRGKPCEAFTADFAVRTGPDQIRRPDAGIDCAPEEAEGADDELVANDPRLVVEVLSPSTRRFDLFDKLTEYQRVESLRHILYIDPDAVAVRHWYREGGGWALRVLEPGIGAEALDGAVEAPDLDLRLALTDVYEGTLALRDAAASDAAVSEAAASLDTPPPPA